MARRGETLWERAQELARVFGGPRGAVMRRHDGYWLKGEQPQAIAARSLADMVGALEEQVALTKNKAGEKSGKALVHVNDAGRLTGYSGTTVARAHRAGLIQGVHKINPASGKMTYYVDKGEALAWAEKARNGHRTAPRRRHKTPATRSDKGQKRISISENGMMGKVSAFVARYSEEPFNMTVKSFVEGACQRELARLKSKGL